MLTAWKRGEFEAWKEYLGRQAGRDRDLSFAGKFALVVVLWHINRDTLGWALKVETIAGGMGTSVRHARRALSELEARGYLNRGPRRGRSNFYWLQPPSSVVLASLASSEASAPKAPQVEILGDSGNGGRICPPRRRGGRTNLSGVGGQICPGSTDKRRAELERKRLAVLSSGSRRTSGWR